MEEGGREGAGAEDKVDAYEMDMGHFHHQSYRATNVAFLDQSQFCAQLNWARDFFKLAGLHHTNVNLKIFHGSIPRPSIHHIYTYPDPFVTFVDPVQSVI